MQPAHDHRRSFDVPCPDVEAAADANHDCLREGRLPAIDEVLLLGNAKRDQDELRLRAGDFVDDVLLVVFAEVTVVRGYDLEPGMHLGQKRLDLSDYL